jgi:hypothetical protein
MWQGTQENRADSFPETPQAPGGGVRIEPLCLIETGRSDLDSALVAVFGVLEGSFDPRRGCFSGA